MSLEEETSTHASTQNTEFDKLGDLLCRRPLAHLDTRSLTNLNLKELRKQQLNRNKLPKNLALLVSHHFVL